MAGLSQRPGGLLLGQVCWSGGHAALGHTGLSMEKPHLPARSFMVDGGSHHPIHLLHMPLTPSPSPAPTQPSASTGIRHSKWDIAKGNAGTVVIQGFPFPRQDALVEFQNSFPLTEISSATVAPEGWSQSLGNASTWTFRMSLA